MIPRVLELLLALPWLLFAILVPVLIRRRPRLRERPPPPDAESPLVSVIVPARNEAENISACLSTLLAATYPRREIIVVDDGSVDGTADIARILESRSNGMLRLVEGQPLPAGWLGKCWACWQGYHAARGGLIVFTDADTRHDDDLLDHAVGAARQEKADLVSVMPRLLVETFWERLILPQILTVLTIRYRDFRGVNRSRSTRHVIANGQFMLFRREAYEAAGGHQAVRRTITEDLALAQRVVEVGGRVFMARAEELIDARMYRSLGGIVEGWSKTLAAGARHSVAPWLRPLRPWIIGLAVIGFWAIPPFVFLASLFGPVHPVAARWAITATAFSLAYWMATNFRLRIPVHHALLYPIGAIIAGLLFFCSAMRGRHVKWRGRSYHVTPTPADHG